MDLKWNSRAVTHGWQKGLRSFYWGLGMDAADFEKPQIGIGTPLNEGNLCNSHTMQLAHWIRDGMAEEGLIGFPFGTPAVSDNITQGLEGGNASLPSRNLIANSAEMVVSSHRFDGMIGLHHCDKNGPGFAMALARLNYPGLVVSGGTIAPGEHCGRPITILDCYDAQAAEAAGSLPAGEAEEIIKRACPGPGGCGIAASFNTWGVFLEAVGLMLPYSSSNPAVDPSKEVECRQVGAAMRRLLERNIRPRDILTRDAFENGVRAIAAMGGSTNGILHILALAREAGVDFSLRDIQPILRETPVLCQFAPRGSRTMIDLFHAGGTPALLKHFFDVGLLNGDCLTVTGETLATNLRDVPKPMLDGELFMDVEEPAKPHADMQICFGSLAPDGIVFKVSSMASPRFEGRAICFESCKELADAAAAGRIQPGSVCVLRGLGPVASGMPEVLVATAALSVPELDGKVALVSDTRVSGVSHGAIGVHCAPEAAVGGPIALVEDGDPISFDLLAGEIRWDVPVDEVERRRAQWTPPPSRIGRGYLAEFAATIMQANDGCVSGVWLRQRDSGHVDLEDGL